ncbi:MAG: 3-isopropylmalate dehydratase small subunit [SAR324 cluster bacterium]|nr:3-isopropylmalate dehydratase small subunit [SAR324 cluster bacterium]
MQEFKKITAVAALMDRVNVDTDAIIPKQFLKKIERTGFGQHLFHDWRYLDDEGTRANPDFVLNHPRYQGAQILVARDNFGCGSSREHAPWALLEYGFCTIIAPSFADIFFNNCFKNGILPVILPGSQVQALFEEVESLEGSQLTVDLESQQVTTPQGKIYPFEVDPFARERLLKGMDDIGWTMQHENRISTFEKNRPSWMSH